MRESISVEALQKKILQVVEDKSLPKLIELYFSDDLKSRFAGSLFDSLGDNPTDCFTPSDLLSLNLLDIRLQPEAVRRISSGEFDESLQTVPSNVHIWEMDLEIYDKANGLWKKLKDVHQVDQTTISKLLARKRPHLLPIQDSIVVKALDLKGLNWWMPLSEVMKEQKLQMRLSELAEFAKNSNNEEIQYTPSLLRVLDVSIWMLHSNSRSAIKARKQA